MPTILAIHEVNDVEHWLRSGKRQEIFGPMGYTARTFVDPNDASRAGLILDGPELDLAQLLQSQEAQEAMKHDGVRPETVRVLVES